jgi:hypothetical protein
MKTLILATQLLLAFTIWLSGVLYAIWAGINIEWLTGGTAHLALVFASFTWTALCGLVTLKMVHKGFLPGS